MLHFNNLEHNCSCIADYFFRTYFWMLNVAGFQGETSTLVIDWPPAKPTSKRVGASGMEGICLLLFTSAWDLLHGMLGFERSL